jgi:hypothetical protein
VRIEFQILPILLCVRRRELLIGVCPHAINLF